MDKTNPELNYFTRIAARAASLRDKTGDPGKYIFTQLREQETSRLLNDWQNAAAAGNEEKFSRLLINDRLDATNIPDLLGTVTFADPGQLPGWIDAFRNLADYLEKYDPASPAMSASSLFDESTIKEIPFIDLLAPFVTFAMSELNQDMEVPPESLLNATALGMLKTQLARVLFSAAGNTFLLEFRVFRSTRQSALNRLFGFAEGEMPGNELYMAFTRRFFKDGWKDFFAEYSVLAGILTTLITNWVRNYRQFLARLAGDLGEISGKLAEGVATGRVQELKGGVSDLHDHGKSVITLKFESGLKLVYKPRNLEVEDAWSKLIRWFNDLGLSPGLKPLEVVLKENYGWAGFIEAEPCATEDEVKNFYTRMGSLIGLIYMLDGNDCHQENLIAAGGHPVLVDLESVMHPEGRTFSLDYAEQAHYQASLQLGHSVFRTGLLPTWISGKEGYIFDISGLGGYGHADSPYQSPKWQNINTDQMEVVYRQGTIRRDMNLPVLRGEVQPPEPWANAISDGFTAVYKLALSHREHIPVHLFAGKEMRFIFRATRIYALILRKLNEPKYMRSGTERGIQLEVITRAFLSDPAPNPYWPVCISEIRQLERNDIPIFRVVSDGKGLHDPDGLICPDFIETPVARQVAEKINGMDQADLEKQVKFIKASLLFRKITPHGNSPDDEISGADSSEIQHTGSDELIKSSLSVARILREEAIFSKDGSCTWLTAAIIPGANRYRVQPVSTDLYDGLSGIALFLSALQRMTGDPEVKTLNEGALKSLNTGIQNIHKYKILSVPGTLGIGSGIPSVMYALIKIAGLLDDPSYIAEAKKLSTLISRKMADDNRMFDLLGGSAGCLLAHLALHGKTGDPEALETAVYCGEHLLKHAAESGDSGFGWHTLNNRVLAGFSHGQAGIAFALMRLYEATGDPRFRETAERAMISENRMFHPDQRNWEDLRESGDPTDPSPKFMTSWCHGAPGIGLSRLVAAKVTGNPVFSDDLTAAMGTTMDCRLYNRDHLCCGNLGRADILLYSASVSSNAEWLAASRKLVAQVVGRAEENGHFTLFNSLDENVFNPGFFQGLSGIGYALLRQVYPGQLPAVLAFG